MQNENKGQCVLVDYIILYGDKENILFIADKHKYRNYVFDLISLLSKEYGVISQRIPFIHNLFVIENIFLGLMSKYSLSLSQCYQRFKNVIDWLGINDLLWLAPKDLTSLELFKCMLVRALTMDSKIIFIDGISLEEFELSLELLRFLDKDNFLWILTEKENNFLDNVEGFKKVYLN